METITMTQVFAKAYVVGWGSATHRPFVIERMVSDEGLVSRPGGTSVDTIKAVYDGEVMRVKLARLYYSDIWRLTPVLGCFPDRKTAEAYAAEVAEMVEHKTALHYPNDVVEHFRHTGRKNFCSLRKGLWTKHFPTWKGLLALTALRDAAAAMPLQLEEFRNDTRLNSDYEEAVAMDYRGEWEEEYRVRWAY